MIDKNYQPSDWPQPMSAERAREVLAKGHDGFGTGCNGVKDYRQLLTPGELFAVSRYWQNEAPGSMSFNDVIRYCARSSL